MGMLINAKLHGIIKTKYPLYSCLSTVPSMRNKFRLCRLMHANFNDVRANFRTENEQLLQEIASNIPVDLSVMYFEHDITASTCMVIKPIFAFECIVLLSERLHCL